MTDVKFLSAHYRTHSMELKPRAMDLAVRGVSDLVHQDVTNVRDLDPESVNTETDPDHIPEKENMNVPQEKGRGSVSVTMKGHTAVKGTMPEIEIVIGIVRGKGN